MPASNYLGFDTVPVRSVFSQAIRFNGYTDGIVVPTGSYKESGTPLGPTNSGNSHATKIGHLHLPNEGNPLNNIIGQFTLEAFVIPDFGGVIIDKPNCYTLKIGEVGKTGPITFDLHTLDPSGTAVAQRVSSATQYPATPEIYGNPVALNAFERYADNTFKPQDVLRSSRELIYICAQFTGKAMRIYANGDLVGDMDFGGEERVVRSFSSDLYIGGKGGEYRGVIESVRISRGVIEPKIQPFVVSQDTIGLWNFEDVVDVPELYFSNGKSRISENVGNDGIGKDSLLDIPMVCIGYDFVNIVANNDLTIPNHPFSAISGNDYSIFRIREEAGGLNASPYEKLASYILNIPISELKHQSWWEGGYLDLTTLGSGTYDADMKITNLNAIINQSGTHPLTGLPRTPRSHSSVDDGLGNITEKTFGSLSLDPMYNPIERIRILGIDFKGGWGGLPYNPDVPAGATSGSYPVGSYNRPPCIVATGTHIKQAAMPLLSCFKYNHCDDTPVWFTLGNTDLLVDAGSTASSPPRAKDALTRYHFTQGQMFRDATSNHNDGYFVSPYSRMRDNMNIPIAISDLAYPVPFTDRLALHYDASREESLLDYAGQKSGEDGKHIFWWKNIAPNTATVPNAGHLSENYALFAWGDGWRYKKVCANANGRAGLVAENPILFNPAGPSNYPGGEPTIDVGVIQPAFPDPSQFYWGGSSWVNGNYPKKVAGVVGEIQPKPIFIDGAGTPLTNIPNSLWPLNDGDWSFYMVMTPQYGSAGARIDMIHSQANNELNVALNVPSQPNLNVDGIAGFGLGNDKQPDAGYPAVVSLRIDESTSTYKWVMVRNGEIEVSTGNNFTTTNPIIFDDVSAAMQLSGIEFFGSMLATSPTASTLLNLAPPGFIVHEIMVYAHYATDDEEQDIRQYLEDKYGVGA